MQKLSASPDATAFAGLYPYPKSGSWFKRTGSRISQSGSDYHLPDAENLREKIHSIRRDIQVQYALCHEECGPEHHVESDITFSMRDVGGICLEEVFIPSVIPQRFIRHDVEVTIREFAGNVGDSILASIPS
ncbi:MAG: hypothetical protein R3B93_05505 [Bacteroidia bacterium]